MIADFYIGAPAAGVHPLEQQAAWLLQQRGWVVPAHAMAVVSELLERAHAESGDFEEMVAQHFARSKRNDDNPDGASRKSGFRFDPAGRLISMTEEELLAADEDGSSVIVLDQGTTVDGRPYWVYIAIRPSKYAEFMRLSAEHAFITFKDYGEILRYGYAEEVPTYVKEEMAREYGTTDIYNELLDRDIETSRVAFLMRQASTRIDAQLAGMLPPGPVRDQPRHSPHEVLVGCDFGGFEALAKVSVGYPADGAHPIEQQAGLLMREQGVAISAGIMGSVKEMLRIARDHGVSFPELVARSLAGYPSPPG